MGKTYDVCALRLVGRVRNTLIKTQQNIEKNHHLTIYSSQCAYDN